MRQARSKSNPFESIAACFFMNRFVLFLYKLEFKTKIKKRYILVLRAAMKMANIDAVFDFQFTDPKYSDGVSKFITSFFGHFIVN